MLRLRGRDAWMGMCCIFLIFFSYIYISISISKFIDEGYRLKMEDRR